ncbi:hypothetical protein [Streptomyces ochraceiscleroticus]|uniref:Uncharacterized protein n=1 Tax=Streptomyces ochraceiscleroticus TaxID=47761 RepID=A0ABW1MHQ9_9ACTN|nr:hypothetical protein [Streptomyces ochraceiscleroticus]
MPTAIAVTSPDLVLAPPDRVTPPAHVLGPPERQSLDDALSQMYFLLEQHGHVLVVHSHAAPQEHVRRLQTLRAVLESDRIALISSALPPLGAGLLVRQLRQLSACDVGPGVLGAAAKLLTYYIHAGALLNSVTRLDAVPVSLKAHARSWVPGSQFAVLAHPTPELVMLGADGARLPGPDFPTHLTVAQGQFVSEWPRSLARQWSVQAVQQAELPAESARWWGTGRLTEFAAGIADTDVLARLVASVHRFPCPWCGLELIGDRCAFCAAPVLPAEHSSPSGTAATRGAGPSGRSR